MDNTDLAAGNACCGAQMFLDSGDGVVFRGAVGPWYSKDTHEFHLNKEEAAELMSLVVKSYRDLHGKPPTELLSTAKRNLTTMSGKASEALSQTRPT